MTRKHFEAIARTIKNRVLWDGENEVALIAHRQMANDIADTLAMFDANFDLERFLTACGLGG